MPAMDAINRRLIVFGLVLGVAFGVVDLILTWAMPVADDDAAALLLFYGPMFFIWAVVSALAARRTGSWLAGVLTGGILAGVTFCTFSLMNMVRVNVFLSELTARDDWRDMVRRFNRSGYHSLRLFINWDYIKGMPLKIGVASIVGAVLGIIGGTIGRLTVSQSHVSSQG